MKKPLITVIVPVLNEAAYIEAMVCSLLKQKQENISMELLLVDGGSTDGTLEKLNVLTTQYPFINIIHNERHITPVAFNKGLAAAKGDYIAILGAHSKYDEDYLETCIAEMQQHDVEGCSGRVIIAEQCKRRSSARLQFTDEQFWRKQQIVQDCKRRDQRAMSLPCF